MNSLTKISVIGLFLFSSATAQAADSIVQGSQCVGSDCNLGESFGFDTGRYKENNLRIHFDDSSGAGSYPNNDWRILINDSSNGGVNYFAIEDSTAGRVPFKIEALAPNNALYVEADGDVGIGTANPVVNLHVVEGDSPTIRLEQDGSSGFAPQTWDLAGNEVNFFVRDVTNGSKLPFRILNDAPENSMFIATDGNVGFGDSSPDASLDINRTNGTAKILVEETNSTKGARTLFEINNNGNPEFRMTNSGNGNSWLFSAGLRFVVKNNAGDWVSRVDANGNMEITGALTTTGGTCGGGGCDLLFHPDTKIESIEEHAASMWANSYLPAVGPTKENEPFNLTEKTGGMLNELEKAHVYIEQLHKRMAKQDQQLQSSVERINKLEAEQDLKITALRAEQAELINAVMLLIRQKDSAILLTGN